ncbi:hypothetical protein GE21DRAFT_964 [Neurospora crassa]|uniref:Uncharacterized protein n=1 Tax=Neurospora crassa (strain ATCC 24698 / 74-OR23-1A / CBS 708.71 / DSM 1257 / FGSC 987) TaxID=367110 RepID=V5IQJ9_NEUCR|nr:hypothetical protein NCU16375 [Neurospora crassa OR74A]ESA43980.1 hypothetical protein NCU16375 [Neurospora crassa OR74A]KHE78951.1 hypothetical protein GE21DRAFT_964 [Neurospora crassa]|eukprot:XP_011393368.1 hypothetical protein NCU16375 [Neurospora crassa OR74A]
MFLRAEGLKGMVRLRFLIVYPPPRFGTEFIITVLLLLLSPDIGFCAQSSSVHGVNDTRREDVCQLLCGRYEETALAKEKTTKTVIHWEAMNACRGKVGEKYYCTYIHSDGLQSPHLNGLIFSSRHTEWEAYA